MPEPHDLGWTPLQEGPHQQVSKDLIPVVPSLRGGVFGACLGQRSVLWSLETCGGGRLGHLSLHFP